MTFTFHTENGRVQFNVTRDLLSLELHESWAIEIIRFLKWWYSGLPTLKAPTSGSTGIRKTIELHRADMELSAAISLKFLGIEKDANILHCLPMEFIAGKMMLVRALAGNLNVNFVKPAGNPFKSFDGKVDFLALTAYQFHKVINDRSAQPLLRKISKIIVGGGDISHSDRKKVIYWNNDIYLTYGMTETLSHIAMQALTGKAARNVFHVLDNSFSIGADTRNCLVIETPFHHAKKIITNDVVDMIDENSFIWKGRADLVINSGGIKYHPEEIENKISPILPYPFFIAAEKDPSLGQRIILIVEDENETTYNDGQFRKKLESAIHDRYAVPKRTYCLPEFAYTQSMKIDRKRNLEILNTK